MEKPCDNASRKKIKKVMDEWKDGKLKSASSGTRVTSHKQAVAIAISEARREGDRVPKKNSP